MASKNKKRRWEALRNFTVPKLDKFDGIATGKYFEDSAEACRIEGSSRRKGEKPLK
jgi:hypothetical protein